MDNFYKLLKRQAIVSALIFTLLGLIFIIFPELPLNIISYCISGTALAFSIILLVKNYKDKSFDFSERFKLSLLLLCAVVSVYFLIKPEFLIQIITIVLGFLIVLNGILKLQTAIDMKRFENNNWWINLIGAIVILTLGLVALFNPFNTDKALMLMIGISFVVSGVSDLTAIFLLKNTSK